MAWLRLRKGDTPGKTFPPCQDSVVLGRDAACEGVLAQGQVFQQHARISPPRRQRSNDHGT
jgi:hypothetical protein